MRLRFGPRAGCGCAAAARRLRGGASIAAGGVCAVFSLHATKLVNSFEGGLIATESDEVAERLRGLRNNGFVNTEAREGRVESVGTNAKMSEIHAAMGLTNVEDIDRILEHNREVFRLYARHLPDGVRLCRPNHPASNFSYVIVRVDPSVREPLIARLREIGVHARSYFYPAHLTPAYRRLARRSRGPRPWPRASSRCRRGCRWTTGPSNRSGGAWSGARPRPAPVSLPVTPTMVPVCATPAAQKMAQPTFAAKAARSHEVRAMKAGA